MLESQSRLRLVVLVLFVLQDLEPIIILSFFLVFYLYVPQFPFLVLKANEDVWPARGGGVSSQERLRYGNGMFHPFPAFVIMQRLHSSNIRRILQHVIGQLVN